MTVEQKRMEETAKRAAQRAVNQLRMSRRTLRAGAGQVRRTEDPINTVVGGVDSKTEYLSRTALSLVVV